MKNRFQILKEDYRFQLEISIIISLSICIVLFLISPDSNKPALKPYEYQSLIFTINDLAPNTSQSKAAVPKPPEPSIYIPDLLEEPAILPDAVYPETETTGSPGDARSATGIRGNSEPVSPGQLPFIPKQILEVLPRNIDNDVSGYIQLKLKIGTDGKVIDYKLVANTTGSKEYLQNVIEAAFKSRWEPVKIKNSEVEYWIDKTYTFNN